MAMRILQVHNLYRDAGGEDAVVTTEADLLRSAGHEVLQHIVQNPQGHAAAAANLALSTWNPFAAREIGRLAEELRADVAHVHNTWFSISPSVLGAIRATGTPTVMTLHNYRTVCGNAFLLRDGRPCQLCVGTHPWHGVRYRCYRDSLLASTAAASSIAFHQGRGTWHSDVDLFLALTQFARETFIAGGLPAQKIRVKPNFVTDAGRRLQPPSESSTVLFVGRISPEKGIEVLIEAWSRARPGNLELVVVGDGPLRAKLESDSVSGIRWVGRLAPAEVATLMRASRALVFPSVWLETFGLVLVEAASAGLGILSSDLGGGAELARSISPTTLVPAGDVTAWASALSRVGDDGWVDSIGASGREFYERDFTPEAALASLVDAYESARSG